MADRPKAMSLREAVEIVALGRLKYGEKVYWDAPKYTTPRGRKEAEARGFVDWDRARAIVDAAVEAHEARIKCGEVQDAEPFDGEAFRVSWERLCDLDDKLRALELGQPEVQP